MGATDRRKPRPGTIVTIRHSIGNNCTHAPTLRKPPLSKLDISFRALNSSKFMAAQLQQYAPPLSINMQFSWF